MIWETLANIPLAQLLGFVAGGLVLNFAPGQDVFFATACGLQGGPRAGALAGLASRLGPGGGARARASAHVRYPCRSLLVAAANPCRCGHFADPARACARAPQCGADYMGRLSGPLMDR
ncbi:hypothetical protein IC63_09485, partial [Paracoccus sphaerophysae]